MTERIENYSKDKHKKQTKSQSNLNANEPQSQTQTSRKNRMFSNNNVSKKIKKKPPQVRYQPYINPQPMPNKAELAKIANIYENNKEGGFSDYLMDDLADKFASLNIS